MHVRCIARQEYTSDAVAIDHTRRRLVYGTPGYALDGVASNFVDRALDARCDRFRSRGELEQRSVRQRTKRDHTAFGERPDMPVAVIDSIDLDVCHEHGLLVDRFAIEPQAERFSHR